MCAHGFSGFQLMLNIVSFHTNKHVNAPPQCDPAGVVGGRLIEYSEAMNRVQHSVQLNVECRRVLSVENTVLCTVLRSRSPPAFKSSFSPLLPPYDVSHLPRCAATLSSSSSSFPFFYSSSFLSSSCSWSIAPQPISPILQYFCL